MTRRRGHWAAALAASGLLMLVLSPAGIAAPRPTANLTVTDGSGNPLPARPAVRPATLMIVTVRGFAVAGPVTMRLARDPGPASTQHADQRGVVRVTYRVPAGLHNGPYLLTFTGRSPAGPAPTPHGTVTVAMPNIGLLPFTVNRRAPRPTTHEPSGHGGSSSDHGPLANTGLDFVALAILGALLVIGGVVLARRPN
jgi:hypothetical protein